MLPWPLFNEAAKHIYAVDEILDIGAGIRPQPFLEIYNRHDHLCIEPHGEYVLWLAQNGYPVISTTAREHLANCFDVDSIFLLDVLEHMEKEEGEEVLALAKKKVREQVIVFTPLGFVEQSYQEGDKDRWGMNGTHWQTHRSGWMPEEFEGWLTIVDPAFHGDHGAFFAIFTA